MIAIHQSQFIPWIPYFFKIFHSDTFVQLDDVQYQKNGLQNRNKIKTPQGDCWLTLPVKQKLGTPINQVEITAVNKNISKIIKTIEINYKKSTFFDEVNKIWDGINDVELNNLFALNNYIFEKIYNLLNLSSSTILSSTLNTVCKKQDLVIEIIKKNGDFDYLSGRGALEYMNLELFKQNNIRVYVTDFKYTEYPQLWTDRIGFIPNLSIIDYLYNNLDSILNYFAFNGSISRII